MSGCSVLARRQLRRRAEDDRATGVVPLPPKPWSLPPPSGDGLKGEGEPRRESVVACRCKEWELHKAPIGYMDKYYKSMMQNSTMEDVTGSVKPLMVFESRFRV